MTLPRMTYKRCPGVGGSPCVATIPQHVQQCRQCRGTEALLARWRKP